MIREVTIRRFKRFDEVSFQLSGHVVLAGPNNTGKTTVLQAIAAWALAFSEWKTRNDFSKHNGHFSRHPISRATFTAVPLRTFDLLWSDRDYHKERPIEITISDHTGWQLGVELRPDTSEQVFVRPTKEADSAFVASYQPSTAFIPPMSGLETDEPVYTRPKQDDLLGKGKPGDVLRNLLVEAHQQSQDAWPSLQQSIRHLFGYELLPPNALGAHIVAEYQETPSGQPLDIASAGSGFQQVLMLLTFLFARPGAVLLIDEPDAHLHVILQDAIYSELRSVAAKKNSQLIVATHSEVVINSVEPSELCMLFHVPRLISDRVERQRLVRALKVLSHVDIMLALQMKGVLYTEDYTDVYTLKEWAQVLGHPVYNAFDRHFFCKEMVSQSRQDGPGIKCDDHYDALKLADPDLPALLLLDRDGNPNLPETEVTGQGMQRLRWKRYEIESYLVHPDALYRFIEHLVGTNPAAVEDARTYFQAQLPQVVADPFGEHLLLNGMKASVEIIPAVLHAAGIHGVEKRRFHEIAALMTPEEVHPEVKEKLAAIQAAFGL